MLAGFTEHRQQHDRAIGTAADTAVRVECNDRTQIGLASQNVTDSPAAGAPTAERNAESVRSLMATRHWPRRSGRPIIRSRHQWSQVTAWLLLA
jgi:hypothetical protein